MTQESQPEQQITIRMPNDMQKGQYANFVSVTVGENETVVDFAFQMPIAGHMNAEAVSRVILSPEVTKKFLSVFQNAVLDFQNSAFVEIRIIVFMFQMIYSQAFRNFLQQANLFSLVAVTSTNPVHA